MIAPRNQNLELPVVTVIGAGIAGLTAAHELAERGFRVQVVESERSGFAEYECAVGGLAANQFARVRSPILDLHPCLAEKSEGDNFIAVESYRDKPLEQTAQRFPLTQSIRFDKRVHGLGLTDAPPDYDAVKRTSYEPPKETPIPTDWRAYWDRHGITNRTKIGDVFNTISNAAQFYMDLYLPELGRRLTFGPPISDNRAWTDGTLTPLQWDTTTDEQVATAKRFAAREGFVVQIIGYTDADGDAEDDRAIAYEWAKWVRDELIAMNYGQIFQLEDRLDVVVRGGADPTFDQGTALGRNLSNRVEFAIVEQAIPGEHGFRFFPAFYRNLFDTMSRTPVFATDGDILGTAFDQLVPTPGASIALGQGGAPQTIDVSRVTSLFEFNETLRLLCEGVGFTVQDLFGLQYYMLRYLTSSAARRVAEAEPVNLLTYIGGTEPSARFSQAAINFLKKAPRALAAMSATEADARTQLDITAQLLPINPSGGAAASDMTLDGPTTTAWLDHWKSYLKNQGVNFFIGEIESLAVVNDRFVPKWKVDLSTGRSVFPEDPDTVFYDAGAQGADIETFRYVLALSYQKASDVIWSVYDAQWAASPFLGIVEFDKNCGRRETKGGGRIPPRRDPETGSEAKSYPLRTISGAQFFFAQDYRFGQGNIYYASASWGLTSISQLSYWRNDIDPIGEFLGQVSVDIGSWHEFAARLSHAKTTNDHADTAWYSSADEIAFQVWTQVKAGFAKEYSAVVKPPRYFHLDRNLVFDEVDDAAPSSSAVLRIIRPGEVKEGNIGDHISFSVEFEPGSDLRPPITPAKGPPIFHILAVEFAQIVTLKWAEVQAVSIVPAAAAEDARESEQAHVDQDVLVAPRALGKRFVVAFRGSSEAGFYITYAAENCPPATETPQPVFIRAPEDRVEALRAKLPAAVAIRRLDDQDQAFELTAADEFVLWVANADGAVKIVDGPRLVVGTPTNAVQLIRLGIGGMSRKASGAVRANAIVRVPEAVKNVTYPFMPERIYGLGVGVGAGEPLTFVSDYGPTPVGVRDKLYDKLTLAAAGLVIAQKLDDDGIVISPISKLPLALIRIMKAPGAPEGAPFPKDANQVFLIQIGDIPIAVDGAGLTPTEVRDKLVDSVEAKASSLVAVEPVGNDSLRVESIVESRQRNIKPVAIAVQNAGQSIEIIGAPALAVSVIQLSLDAPRPGRGGDNPAQGFVVLRNNAEFLINIPGQWPWRPGLYQDPYEIPKKYRAIAANFGDQNPDIYYGTDSNCRLFEHWAPAGTYMATYTRMTTMESANESGRHAAAAIIFKLLASETRSPTGKPFGLVANFPSVWRVEDYEPADLKYAKELDSALFAKGLPHVLDILGVTDLVNAVLESSVGDKSIFTQAMRLIRAAVVQPKQQQQSVADLKALLARLTGALGRNLGSL